MTIQIATANRLRDGAVVYLAPDGRWSARISDAESALDDAAAAELLQSATRSDAVVGAYLMPVEPGLEDLRPLSTRELIRAGGGPAAPEFPAADTAEAEFPSLAGRAG